MKYAIIEAQGHQYKVEPGGVLEVNRLKAEPGTVVEFDQVLLIVDDDGTVHVGTPTIPQARVKATVQRHFRGPKILVFKYKPRKRYRRRRGHRQDFTRLVVDSIDLGATA